MKITNGVEHQMELVEFVAAGKQRAPVKHLGEDTAGAPDVDSGVVLARRQHLLRGAVPRGAQVLRQVALQTEATDESGDTKPDM